MAIFLMGLFSENGSTLQQQSGSNAWTTPERSEATSWGCEGDILTMHQTASALLAESPRLHVLTVTFQTDIQHALPTPSPVGS